MYALCALCVCLTAATALPAARELRAFLFPARETFSAGGDRPAPAAAPVSSPSPAPDKARVRINTATLEELTALPGIGETLAARIIQEREQNGPFAYPQDLTAVPGISRKTVENLTPFLDFSLNP